MIKKFTTVIIVMIGVLMASCQSSIPNEDLFSEDIDVIYLGNSDFWISTDFTSFKIYDFNYKSYKVYFGKKEANAGKSYSSSGQLSLYDVYDFPENQVFDITVDVVSDEKIVKRMVIEDILITRNSDSEDYERKDEWKTAKTIYADGFSGSMKVFEEYSDLILLRLTGATGVDISTLPVSESIKIFRAYLSDINGDIKHLANLSNVEDLMLSTGYLSGDIEVFSSLPNIRRIGISNHSVITGDISVFKELESLEFISMHNNYNIMGSVNSLRNLKLLKIINFSWCKKLTGDLTAFSNMNELQFLDLNHCENITGNLSSLPESELLHTVNVEGCPLITDD